MPKLIVSIDNTVIKEVQLTKDRSTIGRRPYNDIVIDNLAVSGEHAVIQLSGAEAVLEDLGSTNGTYVNGKTIKRHILVHDDLIEIGRQQMRYVSDLRIEAARPSSGPERLTVAAPTAPAHAAVGPRVRVASGATAGRELPLTKMVTTVGKPGVSVASITRKPNGFELAQVDGDHVATVNGVALDAGPIILKNHDRIELGGIRLQFIDL